MREKMEIVFRKILHVLEFIIALMTLFVIVGMLGLEVYKMKRTSMTLISIVPRKGKKKCDMM